MIHTARQSPKFLKLVRRLRPLVGQSIVDADGIATCVLERLWHATTTGAIRGDIGQFENDVIAEMCGWLGNADELIEMLIECRYLDECDTHRLLVHDWHEHAPNHVKGNVTRCGGFIRCTTKPATPSVALEDHPLGTSPGPVPKEPSQTTGAPNLTQPNPTQPNQSTLAAKTPVYPVWFDDFWKSYPANAQGRRRGKSECFAEVRKLPESDQQLLIAAAKAYRKESPEFVRDPIRFIRKDFWRDYLEETDRPAHLPEPKSKRPINPEQARYRLVKSGITDARDWSDTKCLAEVVGL